MADLSPSATTTTQLSSTIQNFSVALKALEETNADGETYYYNKNFTTYHGYYRTIPELKQAIDSFVMWAFGLGYSAKDVRTELILEHITGNGKETFDDIIRNFLTVGLFNGDSYLEIIRDPETDLLINLKNLNPVNVREVYNRKGMLIGYDVNNAVEGTAWSRLNPEKILHYKHKRVASELGGVSVVESCKWIIDARNEAMADKRRILHRSTIRVLEVDTDDTAMLNTVRTQYAEAIKNGEVLLLPKGNAAFQDVPPMSTQEHSEWIRYLESAFYKAVGVPEIILGGAQEYSEASSKVSHLTFEQPHMTARRQIERLLWNQLQIDIDFDEPTSLKEEMNASEAANTGQVGFQPNDMMASMGRTE